MKTQVFGIEIEMTGITRKAAAECVKEQIGSIWLEHFGGTYDAYHVMDEEGRKWKLVLNASIEKIDGAVATIMALDRVIRNQGSSGSVYDDRGILIL